MRRLAMKADEMFAPLIVAWKIAAKSQSINGSPQIREVTI